MNTLVGKAVKWKHVNQITGVPIVNVRGFIAAIAGLDSGSRYRVAVQSEDGSLALLDYSDLIVGPRWDESDGPGALQVFYSEAPVTTTVTLNLDGPIVLPQKRGPGRPKKDPNVE